MQFCNVFKILLFLVLVAARLPSLAAKNLKELAPFPVGVGISDRIASRPEDCPLLKREFSLVTPENCMKPDAIQSQPAAKPATTLHEAPLDRFF